MRYVFLMDPIHTINYRKDSTFVLMEEAQRRGHEVLYGVPWEVWVDQGRPRAALRHTKVMRGEPHFECGPVFSVYLDETDVVFMRKDPPFDMDYVFSTYMLDLLPGKAMVVNDPVGLKKANEKMYALGFPELVPRTLVAREMHLLKAFLEELGGQMIVKPWDGNGGRGVLLVRQDDRNLNSLLELSTGDEKRYVIAQQYLPEVRRGDKRIILIDGEARGAILRVPAENEHRGNMHVGAVALKTSLTAREKEICEAIGPTLRKDGLLFVGIDVIGDYMTEINVTSPTGLQEINAFDGVCLEAEILDRVEARLQAGSRRLVP